MARLECSAPRKCRTARLDPTPTQYRRYVPESMHRALSRLHMFVPTCGPSSRAFPNRCCFETAHEGGVPGVVEVFGARLRIDLDAIAPLVSVVRRMQRLMQIADKMDQERQIAGSPPSVVVLFFEASRIFVDLAGDAITAGASQRQSIRSTVFQTNVDEVPGRRRRIFFAELPVRANRGRFHRGCNLIRRHAKDVRHMALRCLGEVVRRNDCDDFVPLISPAPRRYRA